MAWKKKKNLCWFNHKNLWLMHSSIKMFLQNHEKVLATTAVLLKWPLKIFSPNTYFRNPSDFKWPKLWLMSKLLEKLSEVLKISRSRNMEQKMYEIISKNTNQQRYPEQLYRLCMFHVLTDFCCYTSQQYLVFNNFLG